MASGKLGIANLSAGITTTVYIVPASILSAISLNMVNTSSVDAYVRVSISTSNTPVTGEYIEYDTKLNPSGVIERTGITMSTGEYLVFRSDVSNVNVRVYGIEEAI